MIKVSEKKKGMNKRDRGGREGGMMGELCNEREEREAPALLGVDSEGCRDRAPVPVCSLGGPLEGALEALQ